MKKHLIALLLLLQSAAFGASNTTYIPQFYPLDQSKVQGYGQGVYNGNVNASTTTNIDLTLSDDVIITGLELITFGATPGDYVELKVMAGGATVGQPVPGPWYVAVNADSDFRLEAPMKIVSGLTLRIIYHATGLLATPGIAVNYKLWKVLI